MTLLEWVRQFRDLHDKSKSARLSQDEKRSYEQARDELAHLLLNVTQATLPEQFSPRKALRMPLKLRVELDLDGVLLPGYSTDVGIGGFGALVSSELPLEKLKGKSLGFSLFLSGPPKPVTGHCKLVSIARRAEQQRVSAAFDDLSEFEAKRVQQVVWDKVLELF